MKMISQLLLAAALSIWALTTSAQTTETSPNLITNTWNNVNTGSHPNNCCTGGPAPLYDPNTNTIHFSYGNTAVHQVIGINTALQGTGIQINGWNWGYDLRNMNGVAGGQNGTDTISVTSFITNNLGQIVQQSDQYYNTQFNWTRFTGTETLNSSMSLENNVNLGIQFVARDHGFWAGYYGPQVSNVSLTANYTVDQCSVNPQSSPSCPGYRTYYNISDDSHAIVPIPFGFSFYGKLFTHSIFFDNGAVSFYTPNQEPQRWGAGNTGGVINGNVSSQFYYSIMPLWTDLINYNGSHYTQGDANYLRYTWDNVSEFGNPSSSNTFSLEIRPTGYIGIQYDQIDVSWATVGMVGNAALGEFATYNSQTNWSVNETVATDCSNALVNPACPGYQQAYFDQQCSINSLHNPSCPGYTQAYFDQQCSIDALYDSACVGYAAAYYDYQCSVDPLYHTGCAGYDVAYLDQQCGLNALYNTTCPGYADAFYVQQCTANPLYDVGCTGYATAFFDQQCGLDGLYNNQCPNYAEAYAKKNILNIGSTTPVAEPIIIAATTDQTPQLVADSVVNQAITATATSVSPAAAATTTVPLTPAPQAVATTTAAETKKEQSKTEAASTAAAPAADADKKDQPKTSRQALAERRLATARANAMEQGKNMANKMGEAATMEAQIAVQNVVVAAMGFTPGFDAYGKVTLQDAVGYKPVNIYQGQRNIDNPSGRRFLTGSDRLHQAMVDQQYGDSK